MPLTAILDGSVPMDATRIDAAEWAGVHDVRPRRDLRCRECGARMHAKSSPTGLRFFAHDRADSACPSRGETPEHRRLKQMLAELVRKLGCVAEIEAMPSVSDAGGWRADVLGTSPRGTRIAFEVQLAAMTVLEGWRRTDRYSADGIGCLWVSPRHAPWMTRIPSCHIVTDGDNSVVDRGLARFQGGRWETAGVVPLQKVVLGMLAGSIVAVQSVHISESTPDRTFWTSPACLLVSVRDAAQQEEHDARVRREQEQAERQQASHLANLRAVAERQERVLQHALSELLATGVEPAQVRLGIPSRGWEGRFPVPLAVAVGNEKSAQGAVVWVVREGRSQLWAVICPVAGWASPSLGASWRRRDVQVYVETEKEASRVS